MLASSALPVPLRVLVVDDSSFMQRRMAELLQRDGDVVVAGTARDGADALRRAAELRPDVITMDIHMPRMDGLLAIEHIMRTQPRPIVVVSSFVRAGSAAAIAALEHGAVELVQKPSEGGISLDLALVADDLLRKVRLAARVRVVRTARRLAPPAAVARGTVSTEPSRHDPAAGETAVFIGCSTGGPAALLHLARQWRGAVLPPIVVAQHLPAEFTTELARHMSEYSGAPVTEATDGVRPGEGRILIAPGGRHIALDSSGALRLSRAVPTEHCVPSVDRLFESAAAVHGARALGIVLTGMGNDGAAGAGALRRAGGTVWVQDEATSIIDGMPRAVREAGHASHVFSLDAIGQAVAGLPLTLLRQ
ncbi:MAG: chemotaxis-specific protein-glutamate methyltransferase CheB [Opitutaceae bacterium]